MNHKARPRQTPSKILHQLSYPVIRKNKAMRLKESRPIGGEVSGCPKQKAFQDEFSSFSVVKAWIWLEITLTISGFPEYTRRLPTTIIRHLGRTEFVGSCFDSLELGMQQQ
jgi:hypothetical protein